MSAVPSIWREELYHPLVVHFPVALLLVSTVLSLAYLVLIRRHEQCAQHLRSALSIMLTLGCLFAWLAVWTGENSEHVVNRVICDPTVTKDHGYYAIVAARIYTVAFVLNIVAGRWWRSLWAHLVVTLTLAVGATALAYAAHLGASLVYQQGAGVYRTSESCEEFG